MAWPDALQALYQEVILDHSRAPRHFRVDPHPDGQAEGYNPLCGDRCQVFVRLEQQAHTRILQSVCFQGEGCAISMASASLMTDALHQLTWEEARNTVRAFPLMLADPDEPDMSRWGKIGVLVGVRAFPMRIKCATLAWHAMQEALAGAGAS